jgi:hypothetical protein
MSPVDDLDRIGRSLVDVLNAWASGTEPGPGALADLFADNVRPDDDDVRRAARTQSHGELTVERVEPTSGAAARVVCRAGDGRRFDVTWSLAPIRPPRVQQYDVTAIAS